MSGRERMPLTPKDVLAVLAPFRTAQGVQPLIAGHIQDVAVEPHADGMHVNVHVDEAWNGSAVSDADRAALARFVQAERPEVSVVRVIPRARTQSAAARVLAKPPRPRPKPPPGATLIAVVSGKGSVGKSTVAVNLGRALANAGHATAILDCDLYGFSVPDLLGLHDAVTTQDGRWVPPRVSGVDVMSMKFFIGDNAPVMWRGPMLGKAIRQMMEQTAWNAPRYMVLDLPPGTGDIALDVHDYFPAAAVLVVTTPDRHAAQVAERAGRMAQHLGRSVVGVVENLSSGVCPACGHETHPLGRGGGARVAEALAVPLLAEIPWVSPLDGAPVGLLPTGHPAAAVYRRLAVRLAQAAPPAPRGS